MHQVTDKPACYADTIERPAGWNDYKIETLGLCHAFASYDDWQKTTPGCDGCARMPLEICQP